MANNPAEISTQRRTFYDIADDLATYQETLAMLEGENPGAWPNGHLAASKQEVMARIEAIGQELAGKAEAIAAVVNRQKSEILLLKGDEQRIHDRRVAMERSADWLKSYVLGVMQANDQTLIRTPKASIRIQRNGGVDPMEMKYPALVPDEYCRFTMQLSYRAYSHICAANPHFVGREDVRITREVNQDLVRATLLEDCPDCGGKGMKVSVAEGIADLPCVVCEGSGKKLVPGANLTERGVHLRVS